MPGTVLSALGINLVEPYSLPRRWVLLASRPYRGDLKHREVKELAQGHTGGVLQNSGFEPRKCGF